MSRHHTEDIEAAEELKDAPGRYRAEVRHRRGWLWDVRLVTAHVIRLPAGPAPGSKPSTEPVGPAPRPLRTESRSDPVGVWGERWANWKARRMVAAAHRKDVREQQPWAVQR